MTPVLDNAVATINDFVEAFLERHKDVELVIPKCSDLYAGKRAYISDASYRLRNLWWDKKNSRYPEHGLMVTLRTVTAPKGLTKPYSMTFHAKDVEGLQLEGL